jgi:hypothetical protein
MGPIDLFQQGVAVIPIVHGQKRPLVDWVKFQERLPTGHEMAEWLSSKHNWAAICGWNGLAVLDFDRMDAYELWLTWAFMAGGTAATVAGNTYRVNTSRGIHLYVYLAEPIRCRKYGLVDIKGIGGYVLIPPSVHPSGAIYQSPVPNAPILKVGRLSEIFPCEDAAPVFPTPKRETKAVVLDPFEAAGHVADFTVDKIAAIKRKYNILQFLTQATPSNAEGRWWECKCPFHSDDNPSFWIDTKNQRCGCHSGCTPKSLDVIGLYARLHDLTEKQAIDELYKKW